MELCYSTTAAPTFLKFKPSLFNPSPSSISLPSRPLVQLLFFTSPKQLPTLPSHQFKKISNPFVASASTAVVDKVTDKLPADLKITETHEPNSRVSYLSRIFSPSPLWTFHYSLWLNFDKPSGSNSL